MFFNNSVGPSKNPFGTQDPLVLKEQQFYTKEPNSPSPFTPREKNPFSPREKNFPGDPFSSKLEDGSSFVSTVMNPYPVVPLSPRETYSSQQFSPSDRVGSTDHIIKMPHQDSTDEKSDSWLPEPFGAFSDKNIRKKFIFKVYSILSMQLLYTVILGVVFFTV